MARDFRLSAPIEDLLDRLERQDHRRFLKSQVPADAMTLDDSQNTPLWPGTAAPAIFPITIATRISPQRRLHGSTRLDVQIRA